MKINKFAEMLAITGMMFVSGANQLAHGQAEKIGNGGRGDEAEFYGFKSEILNWVRNYELRGLSLGSFDGQQLSKQLLDQPVRINFVETPLLVGSKVRTCKNYPEQALIECQAAAWRKESVHSKYSLVFHELLGLVGVEKNVGEESDYAISGQIRDFIDSTTSYSLSSIRLKKNEKQGVMCIGINNDRAEKNKKTSSEMISILTNGTVFSIKQLNTLKSDGTSHCTNAATDCLYDAGEGKLELDEWSSLNSLEQTVLVGNMQRKLTLLMPSQENDYRELNGESQVKMGVLKEEILGKSPKSYSYDCFWNPTDNQEVDTVFFRQEIRKFLK